MNEGHNNSNDSVAPTDLRNTDIETFGQEEIPLINMNRKSKITDFDLSTLNSEYSNIGTTPEGYFTEKPKKVLNIKTVSIILGIFLVIGIIGFGIYYFLSSTRVVAEDAVRTKNLKISIGNKLSLKLDDYAEFKNMKATNCILDVKNVNINKIGKYKFSIKCGINEYKGNISIIDDKAPDIVTKPAFKNIGQELDVNDFILSCADESECMYELTNFDDLKSKIAEEGIYKANIKTFDKAGNTDSISEMLVVSSKSINKIYICSYNDIELKEYDAIYNVIDSVSFEGDIGTDLVTKFVYKINSREAYDKLKNGVDEKGLLKIGNVSGEAIFFDKTKTINLYTFDTVINSGYFSDNRMDTIQKFYNSLGYSCQLFSN